MAEWKRSTFDLPDDHGWTARPGNSIFVANRGAVLFEYPSDWVIKPDGNSICLYDREAPDDNMRLQVSVLRLGPDRAIVDWSAMPPLASLMEDAVRPAPHGKDRCSARRNLEYLWLEMDFTTRKRKAHSRACLARGGNVQAFITMEYWPEDRGVADQPLKLAEPVRQPAPVAGRRCRLVIGRREVANSGAATSGAANRHGTREPEAAQHGPSGGRLHGVRAGAPAARSRVEPWSTPCPRQNGIVWREPPAAESASGRIEGTQSFSPRITDGVRLGPKTGS